ncbi:MAG: methyltransferase [Bacteroidetes bacterium]|nr:methyltransferase [Bacteroidota bacterium]
MANPYFRFKEFIIHQHGGVFKVNTDGVLLGAWANVSNPSSILEIGSGTGVIAFMMAQRFPQATIKSIDIQKEAIEVCRSNIAANSPRYAHIEFICGDVLSIHPAKAYDLIISNPPFFEENSHSASEVEKIAKHSTALNRVQWCEVVQGNLCQDGFAYLIYPFNAAEALEGEFEKAGLYIIEKCLVRPNPHKPWHRVMYKLGKQKPMLIREMDLTILGEHGYSAEYRRLTEAFYL